MKGVQNRPCMYVWLIYSCSINLYYVYLFILLPWVSFPIWSEDNRMTLTMNSTTMENQSWKIYHQFNLTKLQMMNFQFVKIIVPDLIPAHAICYNLCLGIMDKGCSHLEAANAHSRTESSFAIARYRQVNFLGCSFWQGTHNLLWFEIITYWGRPST